MLTRVADFKTHFFGSAWANYDTARQGTLRLCPPQDRQAELESDYEKMRLTGMFMATPLPFATLLEVLREAENTINQQPV